MVKCTNCQQGFELRSKQQEVAMNKTGRVFCSDSCKAKNKYNRTKKSVKKVRKYDCSECGEPFETDLGTTYGHFKKGHNVYCSGKCRSKHSNRTRNDNAPVAGICPTCNTEFRSVIKGKKYCSMDCYTSSISFKTRMKEMNATLQKRRLEEAGIEFTKEGVAILPTRTCPNCETVFELKKPSDKKKYCNNDCRRQYFANRFDRWIANPETLALPQNFDEFMGQEQLPCLIDGCDWKGEHLGRHVNIVHGVTAEKFKELAGFNHGTGLVGSSLRKHLRDRMLSWIEDGTIVPLGADLPRPASETKRRKQRLEGKEHYKKARAIIEASGPARPPRPCKQCGKPSPQPTVGRTDYCSTKCRSKFYSLKGLKPLNCDYCGAEFMAKRTQQRRNAKGLPICCSLDCRNKMNMANCLKQTGKSDPVFQRSK